MLKMKISNITDYNVVDQKTENSNNLHIRKRNLTLSTRSTNNAQSGNYHSGGDYVQRALSAVGEYHMYGWYNNWWFRIAQEWSINPTGIGARATEQRSRNRAL